MSTRLVNMRVERGTVYIGRRSGSAHFGNPFSHKRGTIAKVRVATRQAAIAAFRDWLSGAAYSDVEPERRVWILANMHTLRGQVLECFCKPLDCHGDVYLELVG